ncbi:MAG: hypothetical protein RBR07_07290 [Arcobacteraceae bacterium]|nr:hypothetical protein [Arcobacteraceae bacterium]
MQSIQCNSIEEVRKNIDSIDKQFQWHYESNNVDWNELSNLYKIAPLGEKKPEDLKIVFENSIYKNS